ncbi:MAG: flagellar hook-length control protein FliK [Candidatus Krumholzibacteriia bacterium]
METGPVAGPLDRLPAAGRSADPGAGFSGLAGLFAALLAGEQASQAAVPAEVAEASEPAGAAAPGDGETEACTGGEETVGKALLGMVPAAATAAGQRLAAVAAAAGGSTGHSADGFAAVWPRSADGHHGGGAAPGAEPAQKHGGSAADGSGPPGRLPNLLAGANGNGSVVAGCFAGRSAVPAPAAAASAGVTTVAAAGGAHGTETAPVPAEVPAAEPVTELAGVEPDADGGSDPQRVIADSAPSRATAMAHVAHGEATAASAGESSARGGPAPEQTVASQGRAGEQPTAAVPAPPEIVRSVHRTEEPPAPIDGSASGTSLAEDAGADADADAPGWVAAPGRAPAGAGGRPATSGGSPAAADPAAGRAIRAQVVDRLLTREIGGQDRVILRLDPAHLGKVQVDLQVRGDRLEVVFRADSAGAERALQEGADELVEALLHRGGRWTEVDVRCARNRDGERSGDQAEERERREREQPERDQQGRGRDGREREGS